jgi:hypothetical protein
MLYNVHGQRVPSARLPMRAVHVQILGGDDNATYLLRHGAALLPTVQLELVCRACLGFGLDPAVALAPVEGRTNFRCSHTSGYVRADRDVNFSRLLDELQWTIRCPLCRTAAVGDNAKTDETFTVTCACTRRELARPGETVVAPAPGAPPMVRVGGRELDQA